MIPSSEKSTAPTHLLSLGFVAVSRPEVNLSVLVEHSLKLFSVWGVIWLIIAFIFFAAGVIVGIVAFKVSIYSFLPVVILTGDFVLGVYRRTERGEFTLPPCSWIQWRLSICTDTECPCHDRCSALVEPIVITLKIRAYMLEVMIPDL
jgi:hypothetical protein